MHPIHYSFGLNVLILLVCGALSYLLENPLILAIGFIVMQHMVGRFEDSPVFNMDEQDDEPKIGFLAPQT